MTNLLGEIYRSWVQGEIELGPKPPFFRRLGRLNSETLEEPRLSSPRITTDQSESVIAHLRDLILSYPTEGSQASWAVKESRILKGDLQGAISSPGIGTAVLAVEFALQNRNESVGERIHACLQWGLAQTDKEEPHLFAGRVFDDATSQSLINTDYRHTFAFAVLLTITGELPAYTNIYLQLLLDRQNADGSWSAHGGDGEAGEIFTVLYALDFLCISISKGLIKDRQLDLGRKSINSGFEWLTRHLCSSSDGNKLWSGGFLEERWDDIVATAWVLYRLTRHISMAPPGWNEVAETAMISMLTKATHEDTWRSTDDIRRFRAESRVAAAVSFSLDRLDLADSNRERAQSFLRVFSKQSISRLSKFPLTPCDIATAGFLLIALERKNYIRQ